MSGPLSSQTAGKEFERVCAEFLRATFLKLEGIRPGKWEIVNGQRRIADCAEYAHLHYLSAICRERRELEAAIGRDYIVSPDILILRLPEPDQTFNRFQPIVDGTSALHASLREANNQRPLLHASISCKLTMRSDRAQNSRSEALNLIRDRKGSTPHIAVVTGEPLPSRIASLSLGTGDIDCVYHMALPELQHAIRETGQSEGIDQLATMVDGNRLRDIADLPLDLAV